VDTIERVYRAQRPEGAVAPPEPARREDAYNEAVRVFGHREQTLADEQRVSARILEQLRRSTPPVPQQVLAIRGAPGQVAGGRLRLRNLTERECRFAFLPRFPFVTRFSPSRLTLAPSASSPVDVRVDLPPDLPLEPRVLLVDVLADGRPAMKLWLDLTPDHAPEEAGG